MAGRFSWVDAGVGLSAVPTAEKTLSHFSNAILPACHCPRQAFSVNAFRQVKA
jgi:hypothetical protein